MTSNGKMLDFTPEEFRGRVTAAQARMKEQGLDALFLTQWENLYYFSGYVTWLIRTSKHRPSILIIPGEGDPVLIIPELEGASASLFSWLDDIRGWSTSYVPMWVDTFRELGISDGVIGAELGEEANLGMPILDWNALREGLPNAKWVDAQPLMYSLRRVKSPKEIEYMREASRIAGEACDAAWQVLGEAMRTGREVTEKDIANAMGARMMEEGALVPGFLNVRAGSAQGMMHNKYATERVIQKGDWIAMDYGAIYKNYNSDLIRVGCFGTPPAGWERYHQLQMDVVSKIEAAVKPGITVAELCAIKKDALATHGLSEPWAGIGHCIGLNIHELPRINPDVDYTLEVGTCFTIEPGFEKEGNTFCIEDLVVVTEDGCEVLTTFPADLFVA